MTPFVFAVSGVKNSGKTTLVEKLVAALVEKGLRVATIKHDAHGFDADVKGRDSYRHRAAGAYGTAVFDKDKYMVVKDGQQSIQGLIACFPEADVIVLEGAKHTSYQKIEIVRSGNSTAPVCDPATLIALATDLHIAIAGVPTVDINDTSSMIDLIIQRMNVNSIKV